MSKGRSKGGRQHIIHRHGGNDTLVMTGIPALMTPAMLNELKLQVASRLNLDRFISEIKHAALPPVLRNLSLLKRLNNIFRNSAPAKRSAAIARFLSTRSPALFRLGLSAFTFLELKIAIGFIKDAVNSLGAGRRKPSTTATPAAFSKIQALMPGRSTHTFKGTATPVKPVDVSVLDDAGKRIFTGNHLLLRNRGVHILRMQREAAKAGVTLKTIGELSTSQSRPSVARALEMADGVIYPRAGVIIFKGGNEDKVNAVLQLDQIFRYGEPSRYLYRAANKAEDENNALKDAKLPLQDTETTTWGNLATNVHNSSYTGKGLKAAVLDTGINQLHPVFEKRKVNARSFIEGEDTHDTDGHGTQVAGILCGQPGTADGLRYGVAQDVELYCGKVLPNGGDGDDDTLIDAVEWALDRGCNIINLSLVRRLRKEEVIFSTVLEDIAAMALQRKCIIIAAAGNFADRAASRPAPVAGPASCPSVMAVAAVDQQLMIYNHSCSQTEKDGPPVNITGPGVHILSTYNEETHFIHDSGTSFATPFVSGIAALLWERDPDMNGRELWEELLKGAAILPHPREDVGAGLVYFK